jgi:hypothetical protein
VIEKLCEQIIEEMEKSVVYEALKKGGATKYASFPMNPISTPANLKEYGENLKKSAK